MYRNMAKIGTKHTIFCDSINSVFQLVHNPAENLVLNIFLFRHYHEITDLKGLQIRRELLEISEIICHTILNKICFYLAFTRLCGFCDSSETHGIICTKKQGKYHRIMAENTLYMEPSLK